MRQNPADSSRVSLASVVLSAVALSLQGCSPHRACKISDIYQLIQVDGKTGLTKMQLERAGVKLCARHLRKEETYHDDACFDPEKVFVNGDLPTAAYGDSNALLLVRCPSTSYPKGKELQRVTCSDDYIGENEDGTLMKALHLRFDNYERASNCLLSDTGLDSDDEDTDKDDQSEPFQVLANTTRKAVPPGNRSHMSVAPHPSSSKVMRNDPTALLSDDGHGVEIIAAAAAAAAALHKDRAAVLARELGSAVLSNGQADVLLAKTDGSIHPHGTVKRHKTSHHQHHSHTHKHRHESVLAAEHSEPIVHHDALVRTESTDPHHE